MKKFTCILAVCTLGAIFALSGCGDSQDPKTVNPDESNAASLEAATPEAIQMGQIVSINGDQITIALAKAPERNASMPQNDSGQAPDGDVQTPPDGQAPDGYGKTPPDGQAPDGDGQAPPHGQTPPDKQHTSTDLEQKSMITLTGENLTFTLSEDTVIQYMIAPASPDVSDNSDDSVNAAQSETVDSDALTLGTVIAVSLDEDGTTALEITIMK